MTMFLLFYCRLQIEVGMVFAGTCCLTGTSLIGTEFAHISFK